MQNLIDRRTNATTKNITIKLSDSAESYKQKILGDEITDEEFKDNYKQFNPLILKKKSTLVLKASFHLINYVLMGMCQMFKEIVEHEKKLHTS